MSDTRELPSDLISAACALQDHAKASGLSCRKIPLVEWDSLPSNVRNLVPQWLKVLLANYNLAGFGLQRMHEIHEYEWERYFCFWTPKNYAERVTPDDPVASKRNGWWLTEELINAGFIPISDESDGDMWVLELKGGPSSPVYIYELSSRENCLISENMALFLTSCELDMT